jgi:hypothetical protein
MRLAQGVLAAVARWVAPALAAALAASSTWAAPAVAPDASAWRHVLSSPNADPDALAEAHLHLGESAEDHGAFLRALEHDREAIAASPQSVWGARAGERIVWIEERSQGGFAPLARLERVRRDPSKSADPGEIEALAADAERFPPGRVRLEARLLVAEAWLGRLHRPAAAIPELAAVAGDPAADPVTARFAERELVDALVSVGRTADARAEADRHRGQLDARFVGRIDRLARRVWLRVASIAAVLAFASLAGFALAGAARRGALREVTGPLRGIALPAAIFAIDVGGVGAVMAYRDEATSARPFVFFAAVLLPVLFATRAWSAVGSRRGAARAGRATLCAATALAMAFLVLDATNPAFLEGFGL